MCISPELAKALSTQKHLLIFKFITIASPGSASASWSLTALPVWWSVLGDQRSVLQKVGLSGKERETGHRIRVSGDPSVLVN